MTDLTINLLSFTAAAAIVGGSYWNAKRRNRNRPCPHRKVLALPPEPGSEIIAIECLVCHATGRGLPVKDSNGVLVDYQHVWNTAHQDLGAPRSRPGR